MDDLRSPVSMIRISELTCDNQGCQILHDNGLNSVGWDSFSILFMMLPRKATTPGIVPDLFFFDKKENILFYIDGIRFNYRKFLKKDPVSDGEKNLTVLIKNLLPNIKGIHLDGTIDDFLEGKLEDIPLYSDFEDILDFMQLADERAAASAELKVQKQKWAAGDQIDAREWDAGDFIDRHLRVKEVLKGGMGVVYIVNDMSSSRLYALKTIQRQFFWDRRTYDMFVREAELWVKLEKHPNIVQAHFVKILGGYPFIFLEYVKGSNLDSDLEKGPLSINQTLDYAIQFCRGMDYAFKKLGIVHRDIKPSNCLLTEDGTLKISDFGLAGIFSDRVEIKEDGYSRLYEDDNARSGSTGAFQGTLPYMAPERFKNSSHYDICSDIYSFGVMLHEMLTGRQPVTGSDIAEFMIAHNREEITHIKIIHPVLPDDLANLVMKCLAKDPAGRFQSFGEIGTELKQFYRSFMKVEYSTKDMEEDLTPDEWMNKGLSLAALSYHEEALKCYDQAIKKDHRMAGAWLAKGNSLFTLEKYKDALLCYNKVIDVEPQNEQSWIKKGYSFFKLKRFQDALSCYNEAISINGENEEAWIKKGLHYTYLKNLAEGLKCYDQALRINERSSEALFYKGILLLDKGENQEAISLFDKALEINPRWVEVWLKKAEILMALSLFEDAIQAYSKVIEIDVDNLPALTGKARCFILLGDFISALSMLSLVCEKDSAQREALYLLYKVCFYLDRLEASLSHCESLLQMEPHNVELLLGKGHILEKLYEFDGALESYQMALKVSPQDPDAQFHVRSMEFRRRIFGECVENLFKREVSFPKGVTSAGLLIPIEEKREFGEYLKNVEKPSPEKLFIMGVNAYQDRALWQAAQFILESLSSKSDNPQAWLWTGKIFEELEFFDNALDSYGEYLKLVPDAANVWLEVGNMYQKKKRVDKLLDCFIEALKVDSRNWKFWILAITNLQNMGGWNWAAAVAMKALKSMRTYYLDMDIREKKYEALLCVILNRYERANELFNEILSSNPRDIFFTSHKGDNYVRLRMEADATNVFFKASRFGKRSPFFLYYLALFNQFILNDETALRYFQLASKKDMHLADASIRRALLMFRQRDVAGALQCLNLVLHQDPCLNRAREVKSIILESQGRVEEALRCIDEGLHINPWDAGLMFNKAAIFRENGEEITRIFDVLDLYRKYHPLEVLPWNMYASILLEEGKIEEAAHYCEKALILDSLSAEAWNNRGVLYTHYQEYDKALKFFSRALEMNQNLVEAWNNRGCLLMRQGNNAEAGLNFNRLQAIDSVFPVGAYNSALYLLKNGSYSKSLVWFDRAADHFEGTRELHVEKAIGHFLNGDRKSAETCLMDSVKVNPESPEVWFLKALMSTASGEFEESLVFYQQVTQRDATFSRAWLCRGISLNAMGQPENGAEAIKKANEIDPWNPCEPDKSALSPEEVRDHMLSILEEPLVVPVSYKPAPSNLNSFMAREIEFFF